MFFCFVGIPDVFADRFRARFIKEMSGHQSTLVPLRMDHNRAYRLNVDHLRASLESFVNYSNKRAGCFDKGAAVVTMKYRWDTVPEIRSFFFPYAPVALLEISEPFAVSGNKAAVQANKLISDLLALARSLIRPVEYLSAELRSRLKRSPILLPLRRFDAPELVSLLDEVSDHMTRASNGDFIRAACDRFEQSYPYQRAGRRTGKFVNPRGVDFSMPGRALHGNLWEGERKDHTEFCILNSRIRLGAAYDGGFHFDCTARGKAYAGDLDNCHDAREPYRGRPHLNVYPNDYIRGG